MISNVQIRLAEIKDLPRINDIYNCRDGNEENCNLCKDKIGAPRELLEPVRESREYFEYPLVQRLYHGSLLVED